MAAVAGRVTSQARKMFDATLKSSPLRVCSPTVDPVTAEERTWVVETGAPTRLPTRMIRAAESWEEKPWTGVIPTWLIFSPTVRMIRQPPTVVPSPMAAAAVTTTQKGTPADLERPNSAMRTSVITPIVFCPSLEPCEKEMAAPEKIVIHLRSLGWATGFLPAALGPASSSVARVTTQARRTPSTGEIRRESMILVSAPHWTPEIQSAASPAPTRLPTRVWELDTGSPQNQVPRFHTSPAIRAASTSFMVITLAGTTSVMIIATAVPTTTAPRKLSRPLMMMAFLLFIALV